MAGADRDAPATVPEASEPGGEFSVMAREGGFLWVLWVKRNCRAALRVSAGQFALCAPPYDMPGDLEDSAWRFAERYATEDGLLMRRRARAWGFPVCRCEWCVWHLSCEAAMSHTGPPSGGPAPGGPRRGCFGRTVGPPLARRWVIAPVCRSGADVGAVTGSSLDFFLVVPPCSAGAGVDWFWFRSRRSQCGARIRVE